MSVYVGERSCLKLYEGVESIDELIARLEDQLGEFRRMKKADVEVDPCFDQQEEGSIGFWTRDPDTVREFDFEEGFDHYSPEGELLCDEPDGPSTCEASAAIAKDGITVLDSKVTVSRRASCN